MLHTLRRFIIQFEAQLSITFVFQTFIVHHSRDLRGLSNLTKSFREFRISLQEVHLSFTSMFILTFHQSSLVNYNQSRGALTCNGIYQFTLSPSQLSTLFKPFNRLVDFTLLQAQLRQCGDGNVAVWINLKCLLAESLGAINVLLPLEKGERLVDKRKNVARLALLVKLDGSVKAFQRFREFLLVEKNFATVKEFGKYSGLE